MGLLTDPSSGQGKLTKFLLQYYSKLCVLLYIVGVLWFISLASPFFNAGTYFSENALLPGLVKSTFREESADAQQYYQELRHETKKHETSIPYPWLLAKFQQIGLDVYSHNFTLRSPLNVNETYYGKNVYGILRAPRASSTEALVLSVPYRAPSSVHLTTLPSIALQLAFAKFAVREKYWAKDIIFLVTDHEQLGMQSWLEAYHQVTCGDEDVLDHGKLKGRAGAIQAAINLELHSVKIGQIDIKIEGLNGQLPNLDLFNLAGKICTKEGVFHTFKGKTPEYHKDPYKEWKYYFKNMLRQMATQATGVPNGNHGLFLRFGIQALTLEGFEESASRSRAGFLTLGRVLEGIFRSLNNLLERFHQSFFFYILPSYDRYISIGLYMPAVCMIAAALVVKACANWCQLQERQDKIGFLQVAVWFVIFHAIGALATTLPQLLKALSHVSQFDTALVLTYSLMGWFLVSINLPMLVTTGNMHLLEIFSLLELGTALICLSMNNISLGMFCAVISAPVALIISPTSNRLYSGVQQVLWLLVHPLSVSFFAVLVNCKLLFPQEDATVLVWKSIMATKDAIIFSIVDSMIYGNWLFTVLCVVLVPNWLCFWCVTFVRKASSDKEKED